MITTYGELKTTIADWLDREDLAGRIPHFIKLAETKVYRTLRTRENEFTKTWTEVDEPLSPIDLPQNFREVKLVILDDIPLENISPQEYHVRVRKGNEGTRAYFTLIERKLYVYPWPTETPDDWGTFTLEMIYYGTESITEMATWNTPTNPNSVPEGLGSAPETSVREDEATTRLLQVAPDVLLYGALSEAYGYLMQVEKKAEYQAMFSAAVADLEQEGAMADLTGSTVGVSSIYFDGRF